MSAHNKSTGRLRAWLVAGLVAIQMAVPSIAAAQTGDKKGYSVPPLLAQETEAALLAAGCERVALTDIKALEELLDNWRAVVPIDASGEALVFCPPNIASGLQSITGERVAGAQSVGQVKGAFGWVSDIYLRSNMFNRVSIGVFKFLFNLVASAGHFIMLAAVETLPRLLTQSAFVNHENVQTFWPQVLSIANMGFLLALVFIALLTALRLDVGGGVRRLLPRLLLAALLVNFSLIIAGVILDISRVVMALMTAIAGFPNLDELPAKIMLAANTGELVKTVEDTFSIGAWEEAAAALVQAVAIWVMAAAVVIVAVGLVVRYIVIILLLIVSPFAYVFLAFPGAAGIAGRWWTTFLRYVIYGPVVLFILLIALKGLGYFNDMLLQFDVFSGSSKIAVTERAFFQILNGFMFTVFLVVAALAGRYAGIIGSATAINLAVRGGQRVRGAVYRRATAPASIAGREVWKGTTRWATGGVKKVAVDAYRTGVAQLKAKAGFEPGSRPAGKRGMEYLAGKPMSPQQRATAREAAQVARMPGGVAANIGHAGVSAPRLQRGYVTRALHDAPGGYDKNIKPLAEKGDMNQMRSLATNEGLMRDLNDNQRLELQMDITANASRQVVERTISRGDRADLLEDLQRAVAAVTKEPGGSKA